MEHCRQCNPLGPTVVYIAKLFPRGDGAVFDAFGRVFSGSIKAGDRVRVLGESFSPDDEEDSAVEEVTGVCIYQARYRVPVPRAYAGTRLSLSPSLCLYICEPSLSASLAHLSLPLYLSTLAIRETGAPLSLPRYLSTLAISKPVAPLSASIFVNSGYQGTGCTSLYACISFNSCYQGSWCASLYVPVPHAYAGVLVSLCISLCRYGIVPEVVQCHRQKTGHLVCPCRSLYDTTSPRAKYTSRSHHVTARCATSGLLLVNT